MVIIWDDTAITLQGGTDRKILCVSTLLNLVTGTFYVYTFKCAAETCVCYDEVIAGPGRPMKVSEGVHKQANSVKNS